MSLLEIVVALTLFGGMAVTLTSVWVAHAKSLEHSLNRLVATDFATSVMNECMAEGYHVTERNERLWMERASYEPGRTSDTFQREPFDVAVAVYETAPPSNVPTPRRVRVVVQFDESGRRGQVELESYVNWEG